MVRVHLDAHFMKLTEKIKINKETAGQRLDVFLCTYLGVTRSQIQKMIRHEMISINNISPKKFGEKLSIGDVINFTPEKKEAKKAKVIIEKKAKKVKIKIIKETSDYLVVEKPAGLLVHRTEADETNTMADLLVEQFPEIKKVGESERRPGIVHRIDREASGLLVVARTPKMFKHLKKQFKSREVEKEYFVLVYGHFGDNHGFIDFEIDRGHDGRMVSRPKTDKLKLKNVEEIQEGKQALTEYWVEKEIGRFSLLRVKIYTGRMHQIRVHMFAMNHPVVGDVLYQNLKLIKKNEIKLDRLFLHAHKLVFHDLNKKEIKCESKLPKELLDYLENLGK